MNHALMITERVSVERFIRSTLFFCHVAML